MAQEFFWFEEFLVHAAFVVCLAKHLYRLMKAM
jgi:hypothetical protein